MNILRYHTAVSALTPLARLSAFQNEVGRLFEMSPFFGERHGSADTNGFSPALDVYQDKDHVLVKAELPGMKKEDIALSLNEGVLTLSGERRQEARDEKSRVRNERFFGRFERAITLPVQVDGTRVTATYEDGILTVTLPKSEAAKPRQIEIASK